MSPRSSPRMDTLYDLGKGLGTGFSMGIFSAGAEVLGGVKPVFLWMRSQPFQEPAPLLSAFHPTSSKWRRGHPGTRA